MPLCFWAIRRWRGHIPTRQNLNVRMTEHLSGRVRARTSGSSFVRHGSLGLLEHIVDACQLSSSTARPGRSVTTRCRARGHVRLQWKRARRHPRSRPLRVSG